MKLKTKKAYTFLYLSILSLSCCSIQAEDTTDKQSINPEIKRLIDTRNNSKKIISSISIRGSKAVSEEAVKNVSGLKKGTVFDYLATEEIIKSIDSLGYFETITIKSKNDGPQRIQIIIEVTEKAHLKGFEIEGNSIIPAKKLVEKTGLESYKAISEHDVKVIEKIIEKEYKDSNYFDVLISSSIDMSDTTPAKAFLRLKIEEGAKTKLAKVNFTGCHQLPEGKIRPNIATKEDWIFSFFDNAGKFSTDLVERDKKIIEEIYQNNGFINARVLEVETNLDQESKNLEITFHIDEGKQHKVRFTLLPEDEEFPRYLVKKVIDIERGSTFSKKNVLDTIEKIKTIYGSKGYIYCDVIPDFKPVNETTIDIEFNIEKGKKYRINDINISGNLATHDNVIRRELVVSEGDLATKAGLDISQDNVEALGYFERDKVNWRLKPVGQDLVDLEMSVKEAKTGSGSLSLAFSPDHGTSMPSAKLCTDVRKRNFAGLGWDVGVGLQLNKNKVGKADVEFFTPYILDQNISFGFNSYIDRVEYEGVASKGFTSPPIESTVGMTSRVGFALLPYDTKIRTLLELGIEKISFGDNVENLLRNNVNSIFKEIALNDKFQSGTLSWFGLSLVKDKRNHPLYPSKGWRAELYQKYVLPGFNSKYSMVKTEGDVRFYAPLIGKERLVFSARAKLGMIGEFSDDKHIPFKEVYKVGGPDTIRGFQWGEAGPLFKENNIPIGAKNMFVANFELITPLTFDNHTDASTPRGFIFYDMGGGWNSPKMSVFDPCLGERRQLAKSDFVRDNMRLRHTIGFGLKLSAPYPIRFDWGYKLDRDRNTHEHPSELHITMNIPL